MKQSNLLLFIAALMLPLCATAGERLFLQVPAVLDPAAPIPTTIKNECALDMLLGNYALSAISRRNGSVQSVATLEQAGADKIVQITILSVHGFGGGAWSGSKSMSVRVDVKKGGATLDSTVLTRASRGGVLGGFSGTCTILDRVTQTLGKDVGNWLARDFNARAVEPVLKAPEPSAKPEPAVAE